MTSPHDQSGRAAIDGASLDDELFYAAALVHDVGLEHPSRGRCFTHRSASAAASAAERAGVDPDRTRLMMDGISIHISPSLRPEQSAIGYYLQAGAIADLAGVRAWELPPDLRIKADRAFPRQRIHEVLSTCWHAEAKNVPEGRARLADDPVARTPNLDRLAAEGVTYTNVFATSRVCAPSRAALITGQYATSIGAHHMRSIDGGYQPLPPPEVKPNGPSSCTPYVRTDGHRKSW